jgi:hypothetical protein
MGYRLDYAYIPSVEEIEEEWQIKKMAKNNRKDICKMQKYDCSNCWKVSCEYNPNTESKRIIN